MATTAIMNIHISPMLSAKFWFSTWFGRRCHLKNFEMATMAAILDIGTERFIAVLNALMLPANLWFNRMYVSGGFSFEEYHDDCHCDHLGYRKLLSSCPNATTKFRVH